jgi:hypothetical protein
MNRERLRMVTADRRAGLTMERRGSCSLVLIIARCAVPSFYFHFFLYICFFLLFYPSPGRIPGVQLLSTLNRVPLYSVNIYMPKNLGKLLPIVPDFDRQIRHLKKPDRAQRPVERAVSHG